MYWVGINVLSKMAVARPHMLEKALYFLLYTALHSDDHPTMPQLGPANNPYRFRSVRELGVVVEGPGVDEGARKALV